MIKKTVLVTMLVLSLVTIGSASPLMDYTAGKTSLDLNIKSSSDLDIEGLDLDGKSSNLDFALTTGLGNNFAIQYRYNTGDSKTYSGSGDLYGYFVDGSAKTTLKSHELNLLYKLDNNVSAFVGWVQVKPGVKVNGTIDGEAFNGSVSSSNNGYQVGIIGTTKLADKLSGYGVLAAGNKLTSYEVGLSYALDKNFDFNLGYKNTNYKNLEIQDSGEFDYKTKGLTFGVTYKF